MCFVHHLEDGFPLLFNFFPKEFNISKLNLAFKSEEQQFSPAYSVSGRIQLSHFGRVFSDMSFKPPDEEEEPLPDPRDEENDDQDNGNDEEAEHAPQPEPEASDPPQEDEDERSESPPIGTGRWNRRRRRRHSSTTPEPEAPQPPPPNQQGGQRGQSPSSDQDDLEPQFLDDLHERAAEQIKLYNNYDELPALHDHHKKFGVSDDTPHNIDVSEIEDDDFIVSLTDSSTSVRFMITFNEATRKPIFNRIIDPRRRRFS